MAKVFNPGIAPVAAEGKTVRERIIDSVIQMAKEMSEGDQPLWLNVFNGDTSDIENTLAPFLGIEEGEEVAIEMYGGRTIKELPIIMSFRWRGGKGLDAGAIYKYYLGKVLATFLPLHEDNHPLVRDLREDSNSPSYLTLEDTFPSGSVVFVLQYDHATHDPYKLAGEG